MNNSNCCDATIIMGDICSECKEHCSPYDFCGSCEDGFDLEELEYVKKNDMLMCENCIESDDGFNPNKDLEKL